MKLYYGYVVFFSMSYNGWMVKVKQTAQTGVDDAGSIAAESFLPTRSWPVLEDCPGWVAAPRIIHEGFY